MATRGSFLAVERYTGATREERRVSVSMHSLQKKVRRLRQTITQKTGLRSKVSCVCVCVHVYCDREQEVRKWVLNKSFQSCVP